MEIAALIMGVFMALFWMSYRLREAARPLTVRKIVIPPLGMSTGAFMYLVPQFRPAPVEILEAVLAGLVCGGILIATTKLERRDGGVFLQRSKAFVFILLGLFAVRFAAKSYLRQSIEFHRLSGMFFLLAFVMIAGWRVAMYLSYRRLTVGGD
jgi:membrane protein CcdC involved in cytochrome C biogenesis